LVERLSTGKENTAISVVWTQSFIFMRFNYSMEKKHASLKTPRFENVLVWTGTEDLHFNSRLKQNFSALRLSSGHREMAKDVNVAI